MSPGAVDPAILKCGSLSFRRYTRSALLLLREEELSHAVPKCLNENRLKMYPIWKNPPPATTINTKIRDPEPARKHFTIMPAFAARRMTNGGNTSANTSLDTSLKEDERRMMYDQFSTAPHPSSVWAISHKPPSSGSFFPDNNNNFMENYQKMMAKKDETMDGRYFF